MLLWVMGDLRTLALFPGSEISPGFFPLAVKRIVAVTTAGSQSRLSLIESYGQPIFDSGFMKFLFRISGGIKF